MVENTNTTQNKQNYLKISQQVWKLEQVLKKKKKNSHSSETWLSLWKVSELQNLFHDLPNLELVKHMMLSMFHCFEVSSWKKLGNVFQKVLPYITSLH